MKLRFPGKLFLVCVAGLFLPSISLLAQQAVSHVRVVRLSYVSGTVAVKRPAATEWSKASVNTPVQEGFEVSTAADSFGEVQFENGSTARLGQLSRVAFDQLALDAEGNKLNRMTFEQGYATFHFLPEKHDTYSVKVADATLTPGGKSLFRTDLENNHVRVAVFNGSVEVVGPSGSAKLGKDKTLEFNTSANELAFNTQHGIVKDSWDKWTEARDAQADLALNDQAVAARGPVYGWSDLDAYGEWAMFPGFGYGWAPFAPLGWAPYSMGMWDMYPGMGLTWISLEPWGWLPYHYGLWNFSPDFGWFWMPGDFGFWSPALVSWFMGPGWVGWAPYGLNPRQGLPRAITTVSGKAIQPGQLITPQSVGYAGFSEGRLLERAPFQSGAGATLTRTAMPARAANSFTTRAGGGHSLAPSSILMGGESGKESELLAEHRMHQPLRVRLGTTLGGRYAVGGTVGEFRGDAFAGMGKRGGMSGSRTSPYSGGNGQPRLSVLPHGQSAEISQGGGEGMTRDGGAGSSSAPSPSVSAPSVSHSGSSSASSGHH